MSVTHASTLANRSLSAKVLSISHEEFTELRMVCREGKIGKGRDFFLLSVTFWPISAPPVSAGQPRLVVNKSSAGHKAYTREWPKPMQLEAGMRNYPERDRWSGVEPLILFLSVVRMVHKRPLMAPSEKLPQLVS